MAKSAGGNGGADWKAAGLKARQERLERFKREGVQVALTFES